MKVAKAIGVSVAIVLLLCITFFLFSIFVLQKHLNEGCEEIAEIATDDRAVAYLDDWVSDNVLNRGYTRVFGMHGSISARSGDQFVDITSLPEESLSGIPSEYLRFGIETLSGDLDLAITSSNVGQINIGLGRNQIILLKNGKSLSNYRGDDEKSGHLLRINKALYAYCADAKF